MKSALVMYADTPSFYLLAAEINQFIEQNSAIFNDVELWLFYDQQKPTQLAKIKANITQIRLIKTNQQYPVETLLEQLQQLQSHHHIEMLFFNADAFGNELATRLSYRQQGSSCLNIEKIILNNQNVVIEKSVYGHNLNASFLLSKVPYCFSIARRATKPAESEPLPYTDNEQSLAPIIEPQWVNNIKVSYSNSENRAESADLVLAIGRGIDNSMIEPLHNLTDKLGAYLGCSRPVVMNGWLESHHMVGVSGLHLSPQICIVAGASGAAAFSAGIRDSQFIIAINNDKNAKIFTIADVAIIDDLQPVLLELMKLLESE